MKQVWSAKAAAMAARLAVLGVLIGAIALLDPALLGSVSLVDSATACGNADVMATEPITAISVLITPSQDSAAFNDVPTSGAPQLTQEATGQNPWSTGAGWLTGEDLSIAMLSSPPGLYTVSYKVASDDGHVVSGSWRFSVASAAPRGLSVSAVTLWPI